MSRPSARNGSRSTSRIRRGLEERGGLWERILEMPLAWATLAVVICTALLMPRLDTDVPTWPAGDVAGYDVVVLRDLSLPDEAATAAARAEARVSGALPGSFGHALERYASAPRVLE